MLVNTDEFEVSTSLGKDDHLFHVLVTEVRLHFPALVHTPCCTVSIVHIRRQSHLCRLRTFAMPAESLHPFHYIRVLAQGFISTPHTPNTSQHVPLSHPPPPPPYSIITGLTPTNAPPKAACVVPLGVLHLQSRHRSLTSLIVIAHCHRSLRVILEVVDSSIYLQYHK